MDVFIINIGDFILLYRYKLKVEILKTDKKIIEIYYLNQLLTYHGVLKFKFMNFKFIDIEIFNIGII